MMWKTSARDDCSKKMGTNRKNIVTNITNWAINTNHFQNILFSLSSLRNANQKTSQVIATDQLHHKFTVNNGRSFLCLFKAIQKNYNPKILSIRIISVSGRACHRLYHSLCVVVIQCYCCQSSDWNLRMHTHTIVLRCTRERCDRLPIKMRWKLIKCYLFYCFPLNAHGIDATEQIFRCSSSPWLNWVRSEESDCKFRSLSSINLLHMFPFMNHFQWLLPQFHFWAPF